MKTELEEYAGVREKAARLKRQKVQGAYVPRLRQFHRGTDALCSFPWRFPRLTSWYTE